MEESTSAQPLSRAISTSGGDPVRSGFAFDARHDQLFALGYPHLRFVVEGAKEDDDPAGSAKKLLTRLAAHQKLVWPSRTARRMVRAWGGGYAVTPSGDLTSEALTAVEVEGEISDEEATLFAKEHLKSQGRQFQHRHQVADFLFLLESMCGPAVLVNATIDALEEFDAEEWKETRGAKQYRADTAYLLGFLVGRLAPTARATARERLEALHKRHASAIGSLPKALDLVLHDVEGAVRSAQRSAEGAPAPRDHFFVQDADLLVSVLDRKQQADADDIALDARHAYLGGGPVLEVFMTRWQEVLRKPKALSFFIDTVGQIRDPLTVRLIADLYFRSKARNAALAWLRDHRAYALPIVADLSAKGAKDLEAKLQ